MFFNDPVLNQMALDPPVEENEGTGVLCGHCHKEIIGTLHRYGNQSFDSYCWNLRFILRIGDEEEQRRDDLQKFLRSEGLMDKPE